MNADRLFQVCVSQGDIPEAEEAVEEHTPTTTQEL